MPQLCLQIGIGRFRLQWGYPGDIDLKSKVEVTSTDVSVVNIELGVKSAKDRPKVRVVET